MITVIEDAGVHKSGNKQYLVECSGTYEVCKGQYIMLVKTFNILGKNNNSFCTKCARKNQVAKDRLKRAEAKAKKMSNFNWNSWLKRGW
jgi:hypothetical protein